jgi:hypothetical protein
MHPGEGEEQLSEGSKDRLANAAGGKPRSKAGRKAGSTDRAKAGDVGRALRTVYDNTLREDVPKDFLDLLGKLS